MSDRDFVAEALFDLALLGVHLSRIGEEWVLWTSSEFGFAVLDDAHATGSSMMPQKKNADIAELARGKAGRSIGHVAGFLATLKGLPLSYNRDLQEDKEPLFDAVDQTALALGALTGMIEAATFDLERMASAADDPMLGATDLAELLVAGGMPFREAHAVVGGLVRESIASGRALADLVRADERLGADGAAILEPGAAVRRRVTAGGGGPDAVATQLERFRERLAADRRPRVSIVGVGADHFLELNGARFRYQEWGDPSAPVVVFLHGVLLHAEPYEAIVERISAAGYRVLVLDQRGHGQSAHRDDYTWQAFVADLAAFWDALGLGLRRRRWALHGRQPRLSLRCAPSGSRAAPRARRLAARGRPVSRRAGVLGCHGEDRASLPIRSPGLHRPGRGAFPASAS